jgi:hypothetical protein
MPSFDAISIASVMVLECFVCDERSGLSRLYAPCWSDLRVTIATLSCCTLEHLKRSEK